MGGVFLVLGVWRVLRSAYGAVGLVVIIMGIRFWSRWDLGNDVWYE